MTPEIRDREMTAYCALLRQALRDLVHAVDAHRCDAQTKVEQWLFGMRMELELAEMTLAMESGRHAEQIVRGLEQLSAETYTLANFLHDQLYGTPRAPRVLTPTEAEVRDALVRIEALTQENRRLYGLLIKEAVP
jgi:hypothetical protein